MAIANKDIHFDPNIAREHLVENQNQDYAKIEAAERDRYDTLAKDSEMLAQIRDSLEQATAKK